MSFIVVEDPNGEWWDGALVEEGRKAQLEARGVVLLPVIPDFFRKSGVGGYHKRAWGGGWTLNNTRPTMVAPLTVFCVHGFEVMYWAARVIAEPEYVERVEKDERGVFSGFVRFVNDSSQVNPNKCGVSPRDFVEMSTLDKRTFSEGGFILRGAVRVSIPQDGHYGFALYGTAPGLRIVWAAASQAAA